jgi:serine/threonine protein kinase
VPPPNDGHPTLDPGTRLVDRYLLEEPLGRAGEGTTYWRAHDELLDRAVGLCLVAGESSGAQRVLNAARRAAAVTDARFLRVLDANDTDGVVYVVSEWVTASTLADLIAERPLTAGHACDLATEVANALEAAHQEGLAHLCLTPEHVLRTTHGQIKVAGLAVDAAVRGLTATDASDAAVRDTQGVAAILYAALTGRWPGAEPSAVAAAPYDGDRVCSPRQVRAGVPVDLDVLVSATLGTARHGGGNVGEPVRTPAELARRLTSTAATSRIAVIAPLSEPHGDTPPPHSSGPYIAPYDDSGAPRRRLVGRLAYLLVGLVLLVGLGLAGWQLVRSDFGGLGGGTADPTSSPSISVATGATTKLAITAATTLDPSPAGDGSENSERAGLAFDGDPATVWNTNIYRQQFGPVGLKKGVGLVLDLGASRQVSSVTVTPVGEDTDLQVRLSDDPGSALADFTKVASSSDASGRTVLTLDKPTTGRYVLIWLTKLPAVDGGFRGQLSEVVVRGSK